MINLTMKDYYNSLRTPFFDKFVRCNKAKTYVFQLHVFKLCSFAIPELALFFKLKQVNVCVKSPRTLFRVLAILIRNCDK